MISGAGKYKAMERGEIHAGFNMNPNIATRGWTADAAMTLYSGFTGTYCG